MTLPERRRAGIPDVRYGTHAEVFEGALDFRRGYGSLDDHAAVEQVELEIRHAGLVAELLLDLPDLFRTIHFIHGEGRAIGLPAFDRKADAANRARHVLGRQFSGVVLDPDLTANDIHVNREESFQPGQAAFDLLGATGTVHSADAHFAAFRVLVGNLSSSAIRVGRC
ncbi:MAG: hypothetical protein WD066_03610 [Planctomycetaceae bacterium]